jgi:hypothetical protein
MIVLAAHGNEGARLFAFDSNRNKLLTVSLTEQDFRSSAGTYKYIVLSAKNMRTIEVGMGDELAVVKLCTPILRR